MKRDPLLTERMHDKLDAIDKESIDRLKSNLRDAYLEMRDLSKRCMIDLQSTEKNDRRIFYFKPESVLLQDMETQRNYREQIIKQVTEAPQILKQPSLAECLAQEELEVLRDDAEPDKVRTYLAQYFQRRSHNLDTRKYKLLLRWAHFALVSAKS